MTALQDIEKEIQQIQQRNKKVEEDKAWETSYTRRIFLIICTYLSIALYLQAIDIALPWLNAIVPALGFMLSTLTLPFLKKWWMRAYNKK